MSLYQHLLNKNEKLAVIGLGYVGLPLALAFAKKISVIGFDIDENRIKLMQQSIDPSKELSKAEFQNCDIIFTSDPDILKQASFFIIAVPTPVDDHNVPDLTAVKSATTLVGNALQLGNYVVLEPTVYPGCTEEDCLPILEKLSGLKVGTDFKIGYSPERINPGDKLHSLQNVVKVVSGWDVESLDLIAKIYELVVEAGVYRAASIKVAEAAKVIENAQRDLNIALMNELSIIFDKMNINTYDVLATAATKWNFLQFSPGLVGGHCIGVDPYYLTYKSAELGYASKLISAGRGINDGMAAYVTKKILQHIIQCNGNVKQSKVLVMGVTFKENVGDIRNSKVVDVVKELLSYHIQVDVVDPCADTMQLKEAYGFHLTKNIGNEYDVALIAVVHDVYKNLGDDYFKNITKAHGLVADLKGFFRNKIESRKYWSL